MIQLHPSGFFKRIFSVVALICMAAAFSVFCPGGSAWSAPPDSVNARLEQFGVTGNVEGSTYGRNPKGFMAKVDGKSYVVDLQNNQIASIENPESVFKNLGWQREKKGDLFIVQFLVRNDSYGPDHHYGEWRGSHHLIPMYILVEYDANNNISPEGNRIFSGEGASPGHYHGVVHEQKHIDLALLFVSEVFPYAEAANLWGTVPEKWPGSYPGVITGNEVNIRTGPGTGYKSLGVFFKGDEVTLLNRVENSAGVWYEVKFYNVQYGWIQGWVNGNYIEERG